MPTPSEQWLAEYQTLCERHGLSICNYAPDTFGLVPLSEDPFPGLCIETHEKVLEQQAAWRRVTLRSKMVSLLMVWRSEALDRSTILDRLAASGDYFGACWNGDRDLLAGLVDEIELEMVATGFFAPRTE